MNQIIPAIITDDVDDLRRKFEAVSGLVEWVQIDFMDGIFVHNTSVSVEDLKMLRDQLSISAHLMVADPESYLDNCRQAGIQQAVFHYEAVTNHQKLLNKIADCGMQRGIAINPETAVSVLESFIGQIDVALLLGVQPGFGAQQFIPGTIEKIKQLRTIDQHVFIAVDGGITKENIKAIKDAGANGFVVGSYIFKSSDIKQATKELQSLIT